MNKKFVRFLAVVLFLAALLVSGCAQKREEKRKNETPKKGGVLTFFIANPAFIDPYNAQESEGVQVVSNIFG